MNPVSFHPRLRRDLTTEEPWSPVAVKIAAVRTAVEAIVRVYIGVGVEQVAVGLDSREEQWRGVWIGR